MGNMWKLISVTYDQYKLMDVDSKFLYFITDTGALMKGTVPFNTAFMLVDSLPEGDFNNNMIYILKDTLEGVVWVDDKWVTVIYAILSGNIDDSKSQTLAVNANQVKKYVSDKINSLDTMVGIKNLSYDVVSKNIKYIVGTEVKSIELSGLIDGIAIKDRNLLISIVGVDLPISVPIPNTLVGKNKVGELLVAKSDGTFDTSGYTIGKATITGEADTLATEAGIMKLLEIEVYKP